MKQNNLASLYAMIIINIFIAGAAWGTLWQKVSDLEKRFDALEGRSHATQPPWYTMPEAKADTLTEKYNAQSRFTK